MPPDGGALIKKTYAADPSARIDCFYVYPTVSHQGTANADMTGDPEVLQAAVKQFTRFAGQCRPFAPLYRQTTAAAMEGLVEGADPDLAYRDVRAAWQAYLKSDNHGRGVVLIGHSQGASLLVRLIAEEIDGKPAQRQLVSAIVTGASLQVPRGQDVGGGIAGGTFRHIPLCRSADQIGCAIAYSTYLASDPPGPKSLFGWPASPGLADACVSPQSLLQRQTVQPALPTLGRVATVLGTTLVENPGLVSAACAEAGDRSFLAISVKPDGPRAPALRQALDDLDRRAPDWGLHGLDLSIALGDLVETVGRQARAWTAASR